MGGGIVISMRKLELSMGVELKMKMKMKMKLRRRRIFHQISEAVKKT